jgi:acetyltransferase
VPNTRSRSAATGRAEASGFLLMTRLIAITSQWGIGELVGEVLRENEPMLRMCSELGFVITPDLSNPPLVLVRKRLEMPQANGA